MTRDRLGAIPFQQDVDVNSALTERLVWVAGLRHVRKILYISSGATVYPRDAAKDGLESDPYGFLKLDAENRLRQIVKIDQSKSVSIVRAWSVSGAYLPTLSKYLFSSIVFQALQGEIVLTSNAPVLRRFVSVSDLISLGMANLGLDGVSIFDTGGELIDSLQLAERTRLLVNREAKIVNRLMEPQNPPDLYHSDGVSWDAVSERHGFTPMTLDQQISAYADFQRTNMSGAFAP